jgi:hypothetical protein
MLRRVLPLLAFAWMIVQGGALLVGIGNPNLVGDPTITPVCLVCGGRSGYFNDGGDIVIGLLTIGLGVARLIVTLPQRRAAS